MSTTQSEDLPRLGRYQVLRKLAQGGMAEIFLAKALGVMGFERVVAIKLIHSSLTKDPEFVKMFIDEARIAMHLHHRNIVQVFDLDKLEDTYFIAMEYIHGVNVYDLYEAIAAKGRWVDTPLALYIVAEVCKGLQFAHTRKGPDGRALGIVHRDISPQNVLLSFEGEVKITDFGIAKAQERLHVTTPGIVKGKYAYMAPEVLADQPATNQVDVFAAGVLLYELLVGENPFAGNTAVETIENVINKEVPAPSMRGAMVQAELDGIALRALAKDPKERFQTAQEFAEALTEHGLNLTQARKDMAAGDTTISLLLADLFPEQAKAMPTAADPSSLESIPLKTDEKDPTGPLKSVAPMPRVLDVPNDKSTDPTTHPPQSETEESDDIDRTRPRPAIDPSYRAEMMEVDERPTERGLPAMKKEPSPVVVSDEDRTLLNANSVQELSPPDASEIVTELPSDGPPPVAPEPRVHDPASVPISQGLAVVQPPVGPNRGKLLGIMGIGLAALLVAGAVVMKNMRGADSIVLPIHTTPSGATVTVNGLVQTDATPMAVTLPVTEGKAHRIVLEKDGFQTETVEFMPLAGVKQHIEKTLEAVLGELTISADPEDATIFINGEKKGQGTFTLEGVEPDKEIVIRVERAGYRAYEVGTRLSPAQPKRTIDVVLTKSR